MFGYTAAQGLVTIRIDPRGYTFDDREVIARHIESGTSSIFVVEGDVIAVQMFVQSLRPTALLMGDVPGDCRVLQGASDEQADAYTVTQ